MTSIKLHQKIFGHFGLVLARVMPRPFTLFAQKYFSNIEITGAEIGVFKGKNARSMLEHMPIKKLYLIDKKKQTEVKSDKIEWIAKNSDYAHKDIKEKLDFIYIDGLHTTEQVRKDIKNYFPLLKYGGMIGGHDINNPAVCKAVFEYFGKFYCVPHVKNCDWWIINRPFEWKYGRDVNDLQATYQN